MSSEPHPFDPNDPSDAMADSFRVQVANMALEAEKAAIFRDLPPAEQLQCIMSGTLTGLLGVCFAYIDAEGRDALVEAIRDFVPSAATNAVEILDRRQDAPQ
jgi:hypothetical protein